MTVYSTHGCGDDKYASVLDACMKMNTHFNILYIFVCIYTL